MAAIYGFHNQNDNNKTHNYDKKIGCNYFSFFLLFSNQTETYIDTRENIGVNKARVTA